MIAASRRYRPELGWKWSSYATVWIRRAIRRGAESGARFLAAHPAEKLHPVRYRRARGHVHDETPEDRESRRLAVRAIQAAIAGLEGPLATVGALMVEGLGRRLIAERLGLPPAKARELCDQVRFHVRCAFGLDQPPASNQGELFALPPVKPKRKRKK